MDLYALLMQEGFRIIGNGLNENGEYGSLGVLQKFRGRIKSMISTMAMVGGRWVQQVG